MLVDLPRLFVMGMSLLPSLFGPLRLSLLWLMRIFFLVVRFQIESWYLAVVLRVFGSLGLVVFEFARFVVVPLTRWMGEMRTCIVIPLLDLRRRLKVVVDVLGEMIRSGFTLARSLELAAQWDCILRAGPVQPLSADDLLRVQDGGTWLVS